MTGSRKTKANAVRDPKPFVALVDWTDVPGLEATTRVKLTGCSDPDAAQAAAQLRIAERRAVVEEDPQDRARFDAALAKVNLSAEMERAREDRRAKMRIGRVSVKKTEQAISEDKWREEKAMRKGRRSAELRTARLPTVSRVDAFGNLARRGHLPEACVRAGLDIDRILTDVEAGVFARSDPDTMISGGVQVSGRRGAPQFMAIEGYVDRYIPWTRTLMDAGYERQGLSGEAIMAVVIAVVRDGVSLATIDSRVERRKGTAMGMLCDGLREYARVAGWMTRNVGG